MKKLRFAIHVVLLMAAFPVLFIVGVTHHQPKEVDQPINKETPVTERSQGATYQGLGLISIIKYYNII
ncbi:MAG: hypothetical protein ABIN36_04665 [Ferruginibacter sp.]